jgi:hypothetical protein
MHRSVLVFALASIVTCYGCDHLSGRTKAAAIAGAPSTEKSTTASPTAPAKVDFSTQIKPVLEAKCQPCHFSGGKVYAKMPFDRPETIRTMGAKLFTRIKDENERRLIRDFLAQG